MKRQLRLLVLGLVAFAPTLVLAQQPDAAAPAAPLKSDDPSVQALLDTKPSTPTDLLNVIGLLLDLRKPEFAKPLMVRLAETTADDATLSALGKQVGTSALFRVAEAKELQPEGKAFADRVLTAMKNAARDPARIAALIGQLQDPSFDVRAAAISNLRSGGDAATQAIVDALLAATIANQRQMLEIALAGMGESARGPLGALLASGDETLIGSAVATLALIDDTSVLNELYVAAFSPSMPAAVRSRAAAALAKRLGKPTTPMEAAGRLFFVADGLYKRQPGPSTEPVAVWHWDAAAKRPATSMLPPRLDELRRASDYARIAGEISGGDPAAKRLSRGAAFEALFWEAVDPAQLTSAIAEWAAAEKPSRADLEALYDQAAAQNRIMAAARLLELVAASAPAAPLLVAADGRPTVLVRAASHPDSTIRFAAVSAVMGLDPQQPFAGSSGVAEALAWFATGAGVDRGLVVDPKAGRGRDIAGMLIEMNLRADSTDDVREALAAAASQADIQLVVVDRILLEPGRGSLLARLRADHRTARMPVVVLCDPQDVELLRSRYYADPYTLVFVRPAQPEHLKSQFAMYGAPGALRLPEPERLRRAQLALASMKHVLESRNPLFNLRAYEQNLLKATASPTLAKDAVGVLGYFGSAAAQRTLADVASSNARPLDLRQAATAAFCESVIRFGTLLTTEEIARQYARYNASESLDRPTQEILAAILDAIEARVATVPPAKSPSAPGASTAP